MVLDLLIGAVCRTSHTPNAASPAPSAPPNAASTMLSASSSRTSRRVPTPNATRSAISRRRPSPRTSSSPATFAQAMSSTSPTAANTTSSTGFTRPVICFSIGTANARNCGGAWNEPSFSTRASSAFICRFAWSTVALGASRATA